MEYPMFGICSLFLKTDYYAKISGIETKYFATSDYKFTDQILDAKIKENELLDKSAMLDS